MLPKTPTRLPLNLMKRTDLQVAPMLQLSFEPQSSTTMALREIFVYLIFLPHRPLSGKEAVAQHKPLSCGNLWLPKQRDRAQASASLRLVQPPSLSFKAKVKSATPLPRMACIWAAGPQLDYKMGACTGLVVPGRAVQLHSFGRDFRCIPCWLRHTFRRFRRNQLPLVDGSS